MSRTLYRSIRHEKSDDTSVVRYRPDPLTLSPAVIYTGNNTLLWLTSDGKTLLGNKGSSGDYNQVIASDDNWRTFRDVGESLPASVEGIRELDDGEILVTTVKSTTAGRHSKAWKSTGYSLDPANCTFTEVCEAGTLISHFNNRWGISVAGRHVTLSEYHGWGEDGAKFVYYSGDYGSTFREVFNLREADVEGRPTPTDRSHVHTAAFDPYYNRIWIVTGDLSNSATYYSDDFGDSWHFVNGSNSVQFTGIMALPDGVIFGTDSTINGVFVSRRTGKEKEPTLEPLHLINDKTNKMTHVFAHPFRLNRCDFSPLLFTAVYAGNEVEWGSYLVGMMNTGDVYELWITDDKIISAFGTTHDGKILITTQEDNTGGNRYVYEVDAPEWIGS